MPLANISLNRIRIGFTIFANQQTATPYLCRMASESQKVTWEVVLLFAVVPPRNSKNVFSKNVGCNSVPASPPWKLTACEPHSITISSGRKWRPTARSWDFKKSFLFTLQTCQQLFFSFQGIQAFKYIPSRIIDTNIISRNSRVFYFVLFCFVIFGGRGNVPNAERKMLSTARPDYI